MVVAADHHPDAQKARAFLAAGCTSDRRVERVKVTQKRGVENSVPVYERRQTFAQTIRNLWAPQTFTSEEFGVEVFQLLRSSQKRKRESRKAFFKKQLEFSWLRFLSGLVSLVLVCSDVPRSGLAISHYPAMYPKLEPDVFQSFGPWFYSVQKLSRDTAQNATARVWSYKFDTTSLSQRAFAEFFQLQTYPDCIMYRSRCPSSTLNGKVVFDMLDSIVNAAAVHPTSRRPSSGRVLAEPVRITLKTENVFLDRLHHYLLPQVFVNHIWRTSQLLYYTPESLHTTGENTRARSICFGFRAHPGFCHELWINFRRSCLETNSECKNVGLLWVDTMRRMQAVQREYPDMQVDLTLLESQEDLQEIKGGISPTGVRKADVTTIIRARQCASRGVDDTTHTPASCSTVFIDEYRYEVGMVYSDAVQWFRVIACLRGVGQAYYYARIAMLFAFCYKIYEDDDDDISESQEPESQRQFWRRRWSQLQETCILIAKTPMQSVIFGSPFPIFCYALAHSIDAAVSYELLSKKFTTQAGIFQLKFQDFLTVGFNQMRSVWLLAAVLHVCIDISTSRRKLEWSPISGVLGVPEFLLSGLSSITILAQYRSTHFRNTRIRKLFESTDSSSIQIIKSRQNMVHRGSGNVQLGGVGIDAKFFVCMLLLLLSFFFVSRCVAYWRTAEGSNNSGSTKAIQTRTPVPYSAGVLWPIGAMSVHWTSDYFCVKHHRKAEMITIRRFTHLINLSKKKKKKIAPAPWLAGAANWRSMASDVIENLPSMLMSSSDFRSIQVQMESLHDRGDDVEATVAFINLVSMSDPLVYFCFVIGGGGGKPLGYYQSLRSPDRFFLLPLGIDTDCSFSAVAQELRLVYRVRSSLLNLSDLVHCG